ncbi:MAG: ABC transporter substrate-binding protein [Cetobacterium sp.]|uniref:ABC transporter substrate-binding protein n=1 Tax=Cetobacterium sp. TaxID=2071632 RepID=UPI0025DF69C8|nr:ABC transporter substrate-binding protein [uncultured Cetobacterium sp.]
MKKIVYLLFVIVAILMGCEKKEETLKMVIPIKTGFKSLAPLRDVSASTKGVMRNMHLGMLEYDVDSKEVKEALAKSYFLDEKTKSITMILREGTKFHNTKDITIDDIKYSYERVAGKDGKAPISSLLSNSLEDIDIINDKTIKMSFNENISLSQIIFEVIDTFIIPKDVSEEEQEKKPIGAGPYKFVEYVPGEKIVLSAFKDFYKGVGDVKEVTFKIFPDTSSQLMAFQAGELDLLQITSDNRKIVEKVSGSSIYDGLANDVRTMFLNHEFEAFKNKEVREAIELGIDKNRLVNILAKDSGVALSTHMSPYMRDYIENIPIQVKDIVKAKELLKNSGYENLSFTLKVVGENSFDNTMAVIIKEELSSIGVNVEIHSLPWTNYFTEVYREHNYEAALLQIVGYPDPYRVLSRYGSMASGNMPQYKNIEIDNLLKEAFNQNSKEEEVKAYKRIQKILTDEVVSIWIMDQGISIALSKKFTNYKAYPFTFIDIFNIKKRG